ncbi:hypothetical protein IX307_001781 [Bacteroides pyogenes]|nr:hypothetical protein [Bacteroides pyogenes]MBR8787452.1 hypothetical protein [Bacteroides pyogenes]MBR8793012.1 hypothetical protein [Bacteroides pyogenes]
MFQTELSSGEIIRKPVQRRASNRHQTGLSVVKTIRKPIQRRATNRFQTEVSASEAAASLRLCPLKGKARFLQEQTETSTKKANNTTHIRPPRNQEKTGALTGITKSFYSVRLSYTEEQTETSTKKESNTTHIRSPRNQEKTGNLTGITKSFHSVRLPYTEEQTKTSIRKANNTTHIRPPRNQEKTEPPSQTSMRKHASLPIAKLKAELFPNAMLLRPFFFRMRNRKTDEPDGMLFIVDGFEQLLCER